MKHLGNIAEDASVSTWWETTDKNGASITRATDGTVKVDRSDGTTITAGITDTEDDPDTGLHRVDVDTSQHGDYAAGYDYSIWVDGAVVDGTIINHLIAEFSIENRFQEVDVVKWLGIACSTKTDGIPQVDVVKWVAQDLTAPGVSGIIPVDLTYIDGSAVDTASAQLGVDLINIAGSAVAADTAQLGVNTVQIEGLDATDQLATYSADVSVATANQIADAVWNEAQLDHITAGSMGASVRSFKRGVFK